MSFQGHFIGYSDLEAMLNATDHCGDVFANCISEKSPTQPQTGMSFSTMMIQVARIDGEIVHYWRWTIATILTLASGEPFDAQESRRARIAGNSAWAGIKSWLEERTRVVEAAISMPKNMNHMGGEQPAFIRYEKSTDSYVLREVSHA